MELSAKQRELCDACVEGNLERVLELVSSGVNPNFVSESHTLLMLAIEHYQVQVTHLLLKHGADPNFPNEDGSRPLHHSIDIEIDAATQANRDEPLCEISKILLGYGADPLLSNNRGETPLHEAIVRNHREVEKDIRRALAARLK